MTAQPRPDKLKRRQRAVRALAALLILALGMFAFVSRTLYVGRSWIREEQAYEAAVAPAPADYDEVALDFGRGFIGPDWQLYFNEPDASIDRAHYANGLDEVLAAAIEKATSTLDIAAFELNSDALRDAIAAAHDRGVQVRVVTDDVHGLQDEGDPQLRDLVQAGVPLRDDDRSGLMHNKFLIIDQRMVWTGSWNYTVNGTYRNNNNALVLESVAAAAAYQAEFDEMFERGEFGKRSRDDGQAVIAIDAGEISILFAAEADEISALIAEIERAQRSIRFMTFIFSLEPLAEAMLLQAANAEVTIEGVFEARNSTASWSQLPRLYCAGAAVRQDGNRYILHHKVIIIDDDTVITGSFNFSRSAAERNDENIVIVRNAGVAALYLEEWRRIWESAENLAPDEVVCD
ncbi:MAG: phospholipase D-like domain-containing protein [Chloroflexi bacterium]|nr:phospholipase D-like domain-containing protein [Chloroflexota bacterium]